MKDFQITHVEIIGKQQMSFFFVISLTAVVADVIMVLEWHSVENRSFLVGDEVKLFVWFPDFVTLSVLFDVVVGDMVAEGHIFVMIDQKLLYKIIISK